jgi:glycosyltransferase involved in cell wall biosynthesis
MNDPKVLHVFGAYDGCAVWRVVQPADVLIGHNFPCAWRFRESEDIDKQTAVADIVAIGRIYWLPGHEDDRERWFRTIHTGNGKRRLVVMEMDDDTVTEDSKRHVTLYHNEWDKEGVEAERHRIATIEAMQLCDAVITTTPRLAKLIQDTTGVPTYAIPNYIRWGYWRKCWQSRKSTDIPKDKIIIGWAGGWRVEEDLAPMIEAWIEIARLHQNVHFVLAGTMHDKYREALPQDRVTYRPWVHANAYPHQYAGFDIACCPLADMPFNHMKTPCKALEAAAAECAVVASKTVYSELITHDKNGMIANTVEEWISFLSDYIQDAHLRKTHARRLGKLVEQRHNLERNCWQWINTWRKIYADGPRYIRDYSAPNLAELTLSGIQRNPGLVAV